MIWPALRAQCLAVSFALSCPGIALAQGEACVAIPSAPRAPGQVEIPSIPLDLQGASTSFSAPALRALEGQFRQSDALVSVGSPPLYTGAGAEQVARMVHTRVLETGTFRSALADGPAPLENERWAGLYSDGSTDLLVLAEPAIQWPPRGVLLAPADVEVVARWLARDAVVVTTYAGKGVVRTVCDGRAESVVRFVATPPKPVQAMGPGGCAAVAMSSSNRVAQPAGVPRLDLNLPGAVINWPVPVRAALLGQVQDHAGQAVLGALAAYDAPPAEVARRYAGRLAELPGWHAAYPSGVRPLKGGGEAVLLSNGEIDTLLLAYPGTAFPPADMPIPAEGRSALRSFAVNKGQAFGTVTVRYEGRGLATAACAGRLDAVFKPE